MASLLNQIVGHKPVIKAILSSVERGRLAPTLCFVGPSGIGKKMVAFAVAQAMVCERDQKPCGECPSCKRIAEGQSESLLVVEPSGLQIKIDQVREVLRFLSLQRVHKAQVVIINEAQALTTQAANALLKSLEEPPEGTHFILVTSSLQALLQTIRSRSQIVRFGVLTVEELRQIHSAPDWVLTSAGGRVDWLEQISEDSGVREQVFEAWTSWLANDFESVLSKTRALVKDKKQSLLVTQIWQQVLRDAMVWGANPEALLHRDFTQLIGQIYQRFSPHLESMAQDAINLEGDIQRNYDRGLSFENYLYRWQKVATQ